MGLFSFVKDVGAKVFGSKEETLGRTTSTQQEPTMVTDKRNPAKEAQLAEYLKNLGIAIEDLDLQYFEADGMVTIGGKAASQEIKEKAVLAVGNVKGVGQVEDYLEVEDPEPEAQYHTVAKGDTLSAISKKYYGSYNKYPLIFEANKPMLKDPDLIYPGQMLRIPLLESNLKP